MHFYVCVCSYTDNILLSNIALDREPGCRMSNAYHYHHIIIIIVMRIIVFITPTPLPSPTTLIPLLLSLTSTWHIVTNFYTWNGASNAIYEWHYGTHALYSYCDKHTAHIK